MTRSMIAAAIALLFWVLPAQAQESECSTWAGPMSQDFNGDGTADLLWRNRNNGAMQLWLLAPDGVTLEKLPVQNPGLRWRIVQIADMNGDCRADIVWRSIRTDATVVIWLMDGATKLGSVSVSGVSWLWDLVPSYLPWQAAWGSATSEAAVE